MLCTTANILEKHQVGKSEYISFTLVHFILKLLKTEDF